MTAPEITEALLAELDALAEKAEVVCARCDIADCHICPRTVFRDAASPDVVRALVALARQGLRYEAIGILHCEPREDDGPAGVVAVLHEVPVFLQTKGNRELDALADDIIARTTLGLEADRE